MGFRFSSILLVIIIFFGVGCANIVPPTGGKKDVTPPKLVSVTPADSQLNARISKLVLRFDEYITLTDANKDVQISPILAVQPTVTNVNKHVTVKIADTLLQNNTTYRISFGKAIRDLHEGNPFTGYTYTFSTGAYFDSLELNGNVLNAFTGMIDTASIIVELYDAKKSDSAVVREKPLYVTPTASDGSFSFKGLPDKVFRIYALKDKNGNLIYDAGDEWIGFNNITVRPGDTAQTPILLKIFKETDSLRSKKDTANVAAQNAALLRSKQAARAKEGFVYVVNVDTSDARKRTQEIIKPVTVTFNKDITTLNKERITLSYDSEGVSKPIIANIHLDTANNAKVLINCNWQQNMLYTLRLLKGFAKDSAGTDAMPSKYTFRTKRDEDYGILHVRIPAKYLSRQYVLLVKNETDTIQQKPITDTLIDLIHLQPGNYTMLIIVDKNGNGKWDTGDLLGKIQPEEIIPYGDPIQLKAGWEHIVDFNQPPVSKTKPKMRTGSSGKFAPPPNK
ncbi:MAG: Ig-like domain-containing protein [Flavipsychrobacter sp.]